MSAITPERAFARHMNYVWLETEGVVRDLLPDDRTPPVHQRFILELPSGQTVLVAHNLDDADRVRINPGDEVRLRGQYLWNASGGLIHWTHHDPDMPGNGGWIRVTQHHKGAG